MTCARVPATSSSMRHWMGWLKLATTPGMSATASRIFPVSSSRVRALVQAERGFSEPTKPVLSTPRASTATPVCPVRETMVWSSGKRLRRCSISPATSSALSSDTLGSSCTSMSKAPSSMIGMNSVPSRGSATAATVSAAAAMVSTMARCVSAQRSAGM